MEQSNARQARIDRAIDRLEITEVLHRQARGTDRADAELLWSCYHPDAIEEHGGNFSGPAQEYIEGAVERIRGMGPMCHYVCNVNIDLQGDRAWVEAYILTFARIEQDGRSFDTLTGARACDRFERRDGEWRIAHRRVVFDWNRDMESREGWCLGLFNPDNPGVHTGRKDHEDLSYLGLGD